MMFCNGLREKNQLLFNQPAIAEKPAEDRSQLGRPKAQQSRDAEIRRKQAELLSSLSQTGSLENPIDVDKDASNCSEPKKEFQQRENYDSGPGKERMDSALQAMKRAHGANRNGMTHPTMIIRM